MFDKIEINNIKELEKLFNDNKSNLERKMLANSVFYYCSGKDITPIIAFNNECSLFIYADIVDGTDIGLKSELQEMHRRLHNNSFALKSIKELKEPRYNKNVEITEWVNDKNKTFYIIFAQCDARMLFRTLYLDNGNYIQPKCICNYRSEFFDGENPFNDIEKRTEYILGHCLSDKYEIACECPYYGDYGEDVKISLFKRMYWYVY